MKYLAVCALLLPLVYGAAVVREGDANSDLVPDISEAKDATDLRIPKLHLLSEMNIVFANTYNFNIKLGNGQTAPDMSNIADGWKSDYADIDFVPDMSNKEDGEQPLHLSVDELIAKMALLHPDMSDAAEAALDTKAEDADQIPDISVAADAIDRKANFYQIPDMSVAADADDKVAVPVPDMSVAADAAEARPLFRLLATQLKKSAAPEADADLIPDMSVAGDAAADESGSLAKRLGLKLH